MYTESRTTPVFSTPPSILFVDLNLAPGETVKCNKILNEQYYALYLLDIIDSYKFDLPKNIPPSYRGKSIKFNYYLVIGSQRSACSAAKSVGAQEHVVQIPFRVFNHVSGIVRFFLNGGNTL